MTNIEVIQNKISTVRKYLNILRDYQNYLPFNATLG